MSACFMVSPPDGTTAGDLMSFPPGGSTAGDLTSLPGGSAGVSNLMSLLTHCSAAGKLMSLPPDGTTGCDLASLLTVATTACCVGGAGIVCVGGAAIVSAGGAVITASAGDITRVSAESAGASIADGDPGTWGETVLFPVGNGWVLLLHGDGTVVNWVAPVVVVSGTSCVVGVPDTV